MLNTVFGAEFRGELFFVLALPQMTYPPALRLLELSIKEERFVAPFMDVLA